MTTSLQRKQINHEDGSSAKPKERRIVTWTQEEDDILREQIRLHGTENWTIIASKFEDKTTRQCRRRWYTYLNSDFKKGGWSPEEDMLLCEAQKIFGNRWTEIAKVVSGRTDNAVKNRFTTLCKKRAKHEALAKENGNAFINPNNKRILIENNFQTQGTLGVGSPLKRLRRAHIPNAIANCTSVNMSHKDSGLTKQQLRPPFAILAQNVHNVDNSQVTTPKDCLINANKNADRTFLRKDDPKVAALMQQAELLSSLAVRVNVENTDQSLESAWKVIENFFGKSKDSEELKNELAEVGLQLDDIKDLVEELRSSDRIQPCQRHPDVYESPSCSEYSTGSTVMSTPASEQGEQSQAEICTMHEDVGSASQSVHLGDNEGVDVSGNKALPCATTDQVFSSPVQEIPLFRSLASTIPSPQFSESERHFLLKTLGLESPASNTITNPLHSPPCRKALLQGR